MCKCYLFSIPNVDNPLAFTVPFRVAELDVTFVAALVVTVGGTLSVDEVKDISLPVVYPALFDATRV